MISDSLLVDAAKTYPRVRFYEGERDGLLVRLAQEAADLMAQRGERGYWRDGHPKWSERHAEIREKLDMTGVEVSAMARPGEGDDIGHEMFKDWEQSRGHWKVVSTPHAKYGDAVAKDDRDIYYGVVIVADL